MSPTLAVFANIMHFAHFGRLLHDKASNASTPATIPYKPLFFWPIRVFPLSSGVFRFTERMSVT